MLREIGATAPGAGYRTVSLMCATCSDWEQAITQDIEQMKPHIREAGVKLLEQEQQ